MICQNCNRQCFNSFLLWMVEFQCLGMVPDALHVASMSNSVETQVTKHQRSAQYLAAPKSWFLAYCLGVLKVLGFEAMYERSTLGTGILTNLVTLFFLWILSILFIDALKSVYLSKIYFKC